MPVAFTGENLKPRKMFLNHVHGSYGRLASLIFFSYPLSWLQPSLSFETSVGDSRAVAILYQLWINLDLFSWIRPLMVPLKAVALCIGCWQVLEEWRALLCQGEPCLCGNAPCEQPSGRVISLRSATCLGAWSSVIALLLCRCGVYFMEGAPSATLCVQLPKAHLHIIRLYQACCLDFSPVWMCSKKVTEVKVLLLTGVVWEVQLTYVTTVCHFPSLLVLWVWQGMEMTVPGMSLHKFK